MTRQDTKERFVISVKVNLKHIFAIAFAAIVMTVNVAALEAEYIGSFEEGLHSPTSIVAGKDMIAVLDPFAGNISFFSPDGPELRKIQITGDAHSLTLLNNQLYAFCDRDRKVVAAYDYTADRQYDELGSEWGLSNPVDIDYSGSLLHVLDAGNSAVYVFDENRALKKIISLIDEEGEKLRYASSFVYDTQGQQYYVIDQTQSRICRFDDNGNYLNSMGSFGAGHGEITRAGEIELTGEGRLIITDRYQGRAVVFGTDGRFQGDFGTGQSGEIPLLMPTGISIDENGLIYVVSSMSARVSVFHLPRIPNDADLVTIVDQYPDDGAELRADEIILEASVEAYGAGKKVAGFEFRLFEEGNDIPLDKSRIVPPGISVDLGDDRQRVTAKWTPNAAFEKNARYLWQSRVHANDFIGEWTPMKSFAVGGLPGIYRLEQNIPNPFNPETKISFSVAEENDVTLEIINILGQRIRILVDERMPSGEYQAVWDGKDEMGEQAASGIYFYRLHSGNFAQTRKMALIR